MSGILWLLIAWVILRGNQTSIAAVGVLLGVVFLLSGINEAGLAALAPGGWKVWHYLVAVLFFLGALWGFIRPVNTFFALASVLGLILLFTAPSRSSRAWPRGGEPLLVGQPDHRDPAGPAGVLGVRLGSGVCPGPADPLILFWVGLMALFRGFTQIMLAFSVHHAGEEAAAVDAASPR